jgi:signal transduction histidine kinase
VSTSGGSKVRILVVEDDQDDVDLLVRALRQGGLDIDWHAVDSAEGLRSALEGRAWDLVIADHSMPGFSGTEALRMIRDGGHDMPFLFLSGTIGEDLAVAAMKTGAQDYIMKGNMGRLVPAIERELRDAEVRRERARLEEQLVQARKIEAIGRLAGGIAHDFNNLLGVIMGYAGLIADALRPGDPNRECAEEILRASEHGAALTGQLLSFSRRQALTLRVVELNAVLLDMSRLLRRVIREDIDLALRLAPEAGFVRADVGRLQQVVMNLVINARDAMPYGGRLRIETDLVEDATAPLGTRALLSVSDTGVGMSAEVRSHIFEPFFTTKEPGRGTGLGLATVYGIVEESEGTIAVETEPGRGTTFRILFPSVAAEPRAVAVSSLAAPVADGTGETILIVEDDPSLLDMLSAALESRGYRVLSAANLAEAENHSEENPSIDLLVTDMVLPGSGGDLVASRLRARRPDLRVLTMSGHAMDHPTGRARHLQKPFTISTLASSVRSLLDS